VRDRPEIWNGVRVPYGLSVGDLARLANGTSPDRWAAFVALAHSPGQAALAVLKESARSADPHVRRIAVQAIGVHPDGAGLSDVIIMLLTDSHQFVVRSACEAAARQRIVQAHDPILRLLDSADDSTRSVAARSLRSLWREGDFERVLQTFTSDPSSEVKREAAWTLRAAASQSTWMQLFAIWQADALPRHRRWAVELAAAFGDEGVLPQLQRLMNDVDGHVRHRATQAIREVEARAQ
jgi:HEAT repeat protein